MVRIKQRYLVIQILYPSATSGNSQQQQQQQKKQHADGKQDFLLDLYAPTPDRVNGPALLRHIRAAIAQLFGEVAGAGLAGMGLMIKYWSNATSTMVVRCRRECLRWVWAAVAFVRSLPLADAKGKPRECVLRVLRVSGTMRKCQEELIRRARQLLGRVKGVEEVHDRGGFAGETDAVEAESVKGKTRVADTNDDREDLGVAVHGLDESDSDDDMLID